MLLKDYASITYVSQTAECVVSSVELGRHYRIYFQLLMACTGIHLYLKQKHEAARVGLQIHCGMCSSMYAYDQYLGGMY